MPSLYGIAYTSYAVRMLQGRDIMQTTAAALPATTLVDLCAGAGAAGCQIDLSQIDTGDAAALHRLGAEIERHGLFVELSIPAASLDSREQFDRVAAMARGLGATTLRVALLMGRRYESFASIDAWHAFVDRSRATLRHIAPAVEAAGLRLGVENHKDWLASELAALLEWVGSPHIGACVDFGNNLALLEDPQAVVDVLAPWALTTHLKDMAVEATGEGFLLSEVPLGDGFLPLAAMIGVLRRTRPDVRFVLEMITRDPLPVPYRREAYWTTRDASDRAAAERIADGLLAAARSSALPRISGLATADAVSLEDEHIRSCTAYAKTVLGL